ncbi:MAG: dihydroorotate dehydrogenase-like protein [Planctomycetes bacterium]|nr:dihydroorotate dehydrogenase-like protein [Planctomycetota bacterium]
MDLTTRYLGLELPHPFMTGASPMADDLDTVRRLEDAGAAAIVMRSLFEEQIRGEELSTIGQEEHHEDSSPEALSYMPAGSRDRLGPEEYLEQIARVKEAVSIPVVASINGTTPGGWLWYASLMEDAGADALELNCYELCTDPEETGQDVELRLLETVQSVKQKVAIPVSVKLSPFYSSLAHLAHGLDARGVDGLVLFNRFLQPDIDVEELEVVRVVHPSDSSILPVRLRWLAILSGRLRAGLAVTGGVHTALDAVKAIMAGADAVQLVSCLLLNGPQHLRTILDDLRRWMNEHEVPSLDMIRGSMNLVRCPDPKAYERANYMEALRNWVPR